LKILGPDGKPALPPKKIRKPPAELLSIVTPAFNESQNLPLLYERLQKALNKLKLAWEWIVVDDHSIDDTYGVMAKIARQDKRVHVLRFAENRGSHLALACALREAKGECAVGMAADLQDPPEAIEQLRRKWKAGAKVVWAVRGEREGESLSTILFARIYYFIIRHLVGLKQVPPSGADFFLLDREILRKLAEAKLRNASILLLICSFGGRQDQILYTKKARAYGQSGWNLRKKFRLFLDSVTMFTMAPLYWLLIAALAIAFLGWTLLQQTHLDPTLFLVGGSALLAGGALLLGDIYFFYRLLVPKPGPLYSVEKRSK
jgi:dolichol-phosphate mannosyltransferase